MNDAGPRSILTEDLPRTLDEYRRDGYRPVMILPADSPREAVMTRGAETLRLVGPETPATEVGADAPVPQWVEGRAGMLYRDLIPGRLGGRLIASHIRIVNGGPVADDVHYHKAAFQMIYCVRGAIKVVYEDQGDPFVLNPGDCVLQPPEIRHRVLEAEASSEVVELAMPAEHETWFDHEMELPNAAADRSRVFGGQRFVRHVAANAEWVRFDRESFKYIRTGIFDATGGLADVRILRCPAEGALPANFPAFESLFFRYVISGRVTMQTDGEPDRHFDGGDAFITSQTLPFSLRCPCDTEILRVEIRA